MRQVKPRQSFHAAVVCVSIGYVSAKTVKDGLETAVWLPTETSHDGQ